MEKIECGVRFLTPAFLGNAEQNGQWRTPPFKALLRQWWRVAYAADHGFVVNSAQMRREEGMLFGNAWLSHQEGDRTVTDHRKSLVRLRLDTWEEGRETKRQWGKQELDRDWKVRHPEAPAPVGPLLYMGYGPLEVERVQRAGQNRPEYATVLKKNAAIQAGETAKLSIAWPPSHRDPELNRLLRVNTPRLRQALLLIHQFGTLGGRSRNGWGSFTLDLDPAPSPGAPPLRPWTEALALDWPHALGQVNGIPLIWQTSPHDDWKKLMRTLAIVKIGLRTQFVFLTGNNAPNPEARHWLSHPVTKHNVSAWRQARLPNSLRFKVRLAPDDPRKLVGVIFHVPCLPPSDFRPNPATITQTWKSVHHLLDELTKTADERQYASICDAERRERLKPQLNPVTLQRIGE